MKTANLNGTAVTYKYNADGLRTYKKVGSTVHEYEYSGDKLVYEKRGDTRFYYRYDAYGNIASIARITADGGIFTVYPITNVRGDVVELRLSNGNLYASYVYDTWGNVLHIYSGTGTTEITDTANLAKQNPFRYRGYYFDAESGLYYLQSRYYDPVTGRFVNPDSLIDTSNVLGFNMYAYCGNNPIMYVDYTGERYFECCPHGNCRSCKGSDNTNTFYTAKINYDDFDDDSYYEPKGKKRINSYKQKQNRRQINNALGKDRKARESVSRDLHNAKKGRRNDDNMPYDNLYGGDYWDYIVVTGAGVAIAWILLNDVSGIGAIDDTAIAPIIYIMKEALAK